MSNTSARGNRLLGLTTIAVLGTGFGTASCQDQHAARGPTPSPTPQPFEQTLLEIGEDFTAWELVGLQATWSPELCRAPDPPSMRRKMGNEFSDAPSGSVHGRKLYTLRVRFADDYQTGEELITYSAHLGAFDADGFRAQLDAPKDTVGQTVVKVTRVPELVYEWREIQVPPPRTDPLDAGATSHEHTVLSSHQTSTTEAIERAHESRRLQAERIAALPETAVQHPDSKNYYIPGEPAELFVMHRFEPNTPGTDDGWIYAVLDAEGDEVIESGLIASCISCHRTAPYGRLFGPKKYLDWLDDIEADRTTEN